MSNEKERMFKVLKDAGLMEHYHETVESIRKETIKGLYNEAELVWDLSPDINRSLYFKLPIFEIKPIKVRPKCSISMMKATLEVRVQVSRELIDGELADPEYDYGNYPYLPYWNMYSSYPKLVYMMSLSEFKSFKQAVDDSEEKHTEKSPRITQEERTNFHAILDQAIDKMNRPKNAQKPHWTEQERDELLSLLKIEVRELSHAMKFKSLDDQNEELYDVINYAMMMADINTRIKDE
jgi:hypothetical protein